MLSAVAMFPAVIVSSQLPQGSPWELPLGLVIVWGIGVAIFGAVLGAKMTFGKLHFGCPTCSTKSLAYPLYRNRMAIDCPHCGSFHIGLLGVKPITTADSGEEDEDHHYEGYALLTYPKTYPALSALVLSPAAASLAITAIIHKFSFFYLLIPGVWCYGVGGFIVISLKSRLIRKNGGWIRASKSPFQFWGTVIIWSIFYLLATYFPIGYAIQEAAKESKPPSTIQPAE